jgi:peptidoglycan hydrolase CwlO-like protein
MKIIIIIIIILICLFFSLTITPITEPLTNPPPSQTTTAEPPPETPITRQSPAQPSSDSGLQTQVNMLSTQITTTNAIALEAKKKVDEITSEIDKLKKSLAERPID